MKTKRDRWIIGQGVHRRAISIAKLNIVIISTWKINQKQNDIHSQKNCPKSPKRQFRLPKMEGWSYLIAFSSFACTFQHFPNILKMIFTRQLRGFLPFIITYTRISSFDQQSSDDFRVSSYRSQMERGVTLVLIPQIYS